MNKMDNIANVDNKANIAHINIANIDDIANKANINIDKKLI